MGDYTFLRINPAAMYICKVSPGRQLFLTKLAHFLPGGNYFGYKRP
jgi:hypothetical protein